MLFRSNVEVQANAISTMLNGDQVKPATPEMEWLLAIAAALLAALVGYTFRGLFSLPLTVAIAAAAFAVVLVEHARGVVFPAVPVELAILFGAAAACGTRLALHDGGNQRLRNAFVGRISPEVLDIVLQTLPLEGESREVTLMLCNVRGFTGHSQGRDPQTMMKELNEHFDQMSECILRHGGMVTQYAGDRVLAMFGAPARRT